MTRPNRTYDVPPVASPWEPVSAVDLSTPARADAPEVRLVDEFEGGAEPDDDEDLVIELRPGDPRLIEAEEMADNWADQYGE